MTYQISYPKFHPEKFFQIDNKAYRIVMVPFHLVYRSSSEEIIAMFVIQIQLCMKLCPEQDEMKLVETLKTKLPDAAFISHRRMRTRCSSLR